MNNKFKGPMVEYLFYCGRFFTFIIIALSMLFVQQSSASNQKTGNDKEAAVIDNPSSAEHVDRSDLLTRRLRELGFRMKWKRTAITVGELKALLGKEDLNDARFSHGAIGLHVYHLREGEIRFVILRKLQLKSRKDLDSYFSRLEDDTTVISVTAIFDPLKEGQESQNPSAIPKAKNDEQREESK